VSNKHFKLREDLSIEFRGVKLFRIEATRDIERFSVKAGDLGGYVEKEVNLRGNAWVSGNARVYGNARVGGDAKVYDNAQVYGNARVFDNATVYGNAEVYGNARVYGDAYMCGDALVYGNACVWGSALVHGNAHVYGNAWVSDNVCVRGDAQVYGYARVYGYSIVCGDKIKNPSDCRNIVQERYNITILPEFLKIGCKFYTKKEWWGFTDREILEMDGKDGLKWWKKWKPILMAICEENGDE
jgi:carbonic anhydrase/acetyltransferase-like protein (isoleucine patch superfamily)